MVQDMVNILNCKRRFLARYGQLKAGHKLPAPQAAAVRATLTRNDEATTKRKVEFELKHRGGFLPLMGHYPVLKWAGSLGSGAGHEQQGREASSSAGQEAAHAAQQNPDNLAGIAASDSLSNQPQIGLAFTDRDKRLFVYMQSWWSKQKKLLAVRRKVGLQHSQQQNLAGAAAGAAVPAHQSQQDIVVLDREPAPV